MHDLGRGPSADHTRNAVVVARDGSGRDAWPFAVVAGTALAALPVVARRRRYVIKI